MSTILKAGRGGAVLKRLATVDLADHLAEARAILEDARRRAAQIASAAQVERERILDEAQRLGHAEGLEKGRARGHLEGRKEALDEARTTFEREQRGLVAALQIAVAELDSVREQLRLAAESNLLQFAVRLASRLTFEVGLEFRETVIENARRAIQLVAAKTDLTIRVHPLDHAAMETFADSALRQLDGSRAVFIVADETMAPGGCVVESGSTVVDARLETQCQALAALLLGKELVDG